MLPEQALVLSIPFSPILPSGIVFILSKFSKKTLFILLI